MEEKKACYKVCIGTLTCISLLSYVIIQTHANQLLPTSQFTAIFTAGPHYCLIDHFPGGQRRNDWKEQTNIKSSSSSSAHSPSIMTTKYSHMQICFIFLTSPPVVHHLVNMKPADGELMLSAIRQHSEHQTTKLPPKHHNLNSTIC